jgi:uncharacterized protein (AIM24 family)
MATLRGPGKIYITSMPFRKWHRTLAPHLSDRGGGNHNAEETGAPE